jgi:competence protein ComEC
MTLVYLTLAWGCGILLARLLWSQGAIGCATPGWPFGALAGAAGLALILWRRQPQARSAAALLLMLLLGAWRYHAHPLAPCATSADLAFYNGDDRRAVWATVEGVVVGYPDVRDVRTFYRLRAEALTIGDATRPVAGDVLVQAPRFPEYHYGDRLRASGQLQTPPVLDDFDYRAYLARQGIHSLMRPATVERLAEGQGSRFWAILYGLRERGSELLNRILPEPAAALANGMLLGIESGIPPTVDEAFKATGTTHVIVISGSNVALLSGVLLALLGRLFGNKRRAALPAIVGIALYVLLVGADAAALRAGLMGALYVLAIALGRQSTALISLFASALVMTLLNPLVLWDVGFQLSFMATLGLILFTPTIQSRFEQLLARRLAQERVRQTMGFLNDALIVTLAAQITTLPVVVAYFGRLSLISLVTNFLILPAQPPIMMGGMATLVFGLIWEPVGRVLAVIPWLFLTYTTAVVRLTAAVPFAWVEVGALGQVLALIYYAVLFGTLGMRRLTQTGWVTLPTRRAVAWAAAAVLPLWLGLTAVSALPDDRLHLFFLPGATGEAALVVTPAGRRAWLWDGRGDGATLTAAARGVFIGWRKGVDAALGPWPGTQAIDPAQLASGAVIRLDENVTLTRVAAGEDWAFVLAYEEFRALLPATLQPGAQAALLAAGADLRVTLLKAPGPDTGTWPTAAFLDATAPQLILWPEGTTYPPDVVARLTARGAIRVPPDALLELITDGRQMWLRLRTDSGTGK